MYIKNKTKQNEEEYIEVPELCEDEEEILFSPTRYIKTTAAFLSIFINLPSIFQSTWVNKKRKQRNKTREWI